MNFVSLLHDRIIDLMIATEKKLEVCFEDYAAILFTLSSVL